MVHDLCNQAAQHEHPKFTTSRTAEGHAGDTAITLVCAFVTVLWFAHCYCIQQNHTPAPIVHTSLQTVCAGAFSAL